jgi:hypothetical protein
MFKRYLQKPLIVLWIAIIVVRASLDEILLRTPHAGPWFDQIYAIFVLAIPIAEVFIFYRALRAYSSSGLPIQAPKAGISGKVLLLLFFYCLPYGLWTYRRDVIDAVAGFHGERWIEFMGLAVGGGMNLLLSGFVIHQMLAERTRRNKVAQAASTQDQPR